MYPCEDCSTFMSFQGSGWDRPGPEWVPCLRFMLCTEPEWAVRSAFARRPCTYHDFDWCDWAEMWYAAVLPPQCSAPETDPLIAELLGEGRPVATWARCTA
jgi:hypothetical protein